MRKVVCINRKGWTDSITHLPIPGPKYLEICQPTGEDGDFYKLQGYDTEYYKPCFVDLIDDFQLNKLETKIPLEA